MTTTGMREYHLDEAAQKLLLLAARGTWDEGQRERALQLAHQVGDWNQFTDVAIRSFGVCLAYRLLRTLPKDTVPPEAMARMQQASRVFAVRSLQFEAAQLNFMTGCLAPLGVRHAFFKGASLGHRYYADPAARPSRDVDVLVDPAMAFAVVRHARQAGYRPLSEIGPSDKDLARWVKQETVYCMHAPNGVLIEIHQSMDHGDGVWDTGEILDRAETIDFRGRPMSMLSTSDLFVYVCMHHTRHFWSHLHWYADLDAVTGHALFDLAEVREVAASLALTTTVEACLELHEFARTADWPHPISVQGTAGAALLARSLECLEGGSSREVELRATRLSADRAFAWQSSLPERAVLFVRKQIRRITGGLARRLRTGFKGG